MIEVSKEAGERKMDIGFIGLGKMGLNMALNVHEQGWPIIGFDVTKEARATAREQGAFRCRFVTGIVESA